MGLYADVEDLRHFGDDENASSNKLKLMLDDLCPSVSNKVRVSKQLAFDDAKRLVLQVLPGSDVCL